MKKLKKKSVDKEKVISDSLDKFIDSLSQGFRQKYGQLGKIKLESIANLEKIELAAICYDYNLKYKFTKILLRKVLSELSEMQLSDIEDVYFSSDNFDFELFYDDLLSETNTNIGEAELKRNLKIGDPNEQLLFDKANRLIELENKKKKEKYPEVTCKIKYPYHKALKDANEKYNLIDPTIFDNPDELKKLVNRFKKFKNKKN